METENIIHIHGDHVTVERYEHCSRQTTRLTLQSRLDLPIAFRPMPKQEEEVRECAQRLAVEIASEGDSASTWHLVVPSTWCMASSTRGTSGRQQTQAAKFEFEATVPAVLEDLTCCVSRTDGRQQVVTSVVTEPIRELIAALEVNELEIGSVLVDAQILGREIERSRDGPRAHSSVVLSVDETSLALVCRPRDPGISGAVKTILLPRDKHVDVLRNILCPLVSTLMEDDCNVVIAPLSDCSETSSQVEQVLRECGIVASVMSSEHVRRKILEGVLKNSGVDFRRGELVNTRRWHSFGMLASRCAVCLGIFLFAYSLLLSLLGGVYARDASLLHERVAQVYQDVFPNAVVPSGAAMRMRSERIKLQALTQHGNESPQQEGGRGLHVLRVLSTVAESLAPDIKMHVDRLTIEENRLLLSGQTIDHAAAGAIVRALHTVPGIRADPPTTKLRADATVDFRLLAKLNGREE